ncbi:MAG: hypothetical protein K6T85_07035 [Gorillibacterium sp.]|nr:hypothetical protein [Gorillibacterium sp.]
MYIVRGNLVYFEDDYTKALVGNVEKIETTPTELIHWLWNEETEQYDEVSREPNPNPPVQPVNELDELKAENADLWYESMTQSAKIEANEIEISALWYEVMSGGGV